MSNLDMLFLSFRLNVSIPKRLIWIPLSILFFIFHFSSKAQNVSAPTGSTPAATETPTTESKLKFVNKIGHWLTAYGMSGEEFVQDQRDSFKTAAFAEVYIECIIDYDTWLFNLLNRVTKLRNEEKQSPYIFFELKFLPKDETLTSYSISAFTLKSSTTINGLDKIASDAFTKYLKDKKYAEPVGSIPDVEKAVKEVLNVLKEKLGNQLAPDMMVRYQNEFFWNGHEINILDTEGNYVELEAINKNIQPYNPNDIVWTNADPSGSKGVVDMTGVSSKAVSYKRKRDSVAMTVNVKRASLTDDVNEILKAAIIEALTYKKQQAKDTLVSLRQDSTKNIQDLAAQIALLERGNFPMENVGGILNPLFPSPQFVSTADSTAAFGNDSKNNDRKRGFEFLRKHKRLKSTIQRKINVVAFADLVVDHPEEIKILLEELLKNSGRLVAQLILNQNAEGKRDVARNIAIDFLNKNLERIAGGRYTEDQTIVPPLPISSVPTELQFVPGKHLYISSSADFAGKDLFRTNIENFLKTDTSLYVFVNYSQDVSTENYLARVKGTRPKGLPGNSKFVAVTLVNIPGSVKVQLMFNSTDEIEPIDYSSQTATADWLEAIIKAKTFLGKYQYIVGLNVIPGTFSKYVAATANNSFSFITSSGHIISIPSTSTDVTFDDRGFLNAFTIPENGSQERYVSAYYTATNQFAGFRKNLIPEETLVNANLYKDYLSKAYEGLNTQIKVSLGFKTSDCGIVLYESNFPLTIDNQSETTGQYNSGGNGFPRLANTDDVKNKLNSQNGDETNSIYGNKIKKISTDKIESPYACDICTAGRKFVEQYTGAIKDEEEYKALVATAKSLCGLPADVLKAFSAEDDLAFKESLDTWFIWTTDNNRRKKLKDEFWLRPDAWQVYNKQFNLFIEIYKKIQSSSTLPYSNNDKIKAIVNARSDEFISLYLIEERIEILRTLLPENDEALTPSGEYNFLNAYVSNSEENAIIKVLRSVTNQVDASKMLLGISQSPFLSNLNLHVDDFGFGGNNYTKLSKEFQRLTLLKYGLDPSKQIPSSVVQSIPQDNRFIYNDDRTFAFSAQNELGGVYYKTVTYDGVAKMTIVRQFCDKTVSTAKFEGKADNKVLVEECIYTTKTYTPGYFDLITIDIVNLDFLPPNMTTANAGSSFVTYAGFIDYVEEKKGTEQVSKVADYTLTAASLTFGVGELMLLARGGASTARVVLASCDIGTELADLIINSDAFADYICGKDAKGNVIKNCQTLNNYKLGNTLAQVTSITASGFDIARNWDDIMRSAKWLDDLPLGLKTDINNSSALRKLFEEATTQSRRELKSAWKVLDEIGSDLSTKTKLLTDLSNQPVAVINKLASDPNNFRIWLNYKEESRILLAKNADVWLKSAESRTLLKNGNYDEVIKLYGGTKVNPYERSQIKFVVDGVPDTKALDDAIEIAKRLDDVPVISTNMGVSENIINEVKQHFFVNEYLIKTENGFTIGRFEKSADDIALWTGAENGFKVDVSYVDNGIRLTIPKSEAANRFKQLVAHEYVESQLMKKGLSYKSLNNLNTTLPYDFGAHDIAPRLMGGYSDFLKLNSNAPSPNNSLTNLDEVVNFYIQNLKL